MRIVRALPYVVSAVSLAIAASSWCYVLELDRREHISTRAETAQAELARIERRDADVNDLIALAQLERARLDGLTASLHQTRIDVNSVEIGVRNLQVRLNARIDAVVKAAVQDLTSLRNQIGGAQRTAQDPLDAADDALGRYIETFWNNRRQQIEQGSSDW